MATIFYTLTDEAPMLATYSFLPVVQAFASTADVDVETRDISLAGRILALFPEHLTEDQRIGDALTELGDLATTPEANIIKLPNVSASMPQLKAAITELQAQGFALPDYPDDPQTDEERDIRVRYDKVKGSAVNPVLREGNSDRRAPAAVKNYARSHPHSMGAWSTDSKTNVATMGADDFRSNEQSVVLAGNDRLTIRHVATDGTTTVLKDALGVLEGEVVDATVMRAASLGTFLSEQIARAKADDVLFSVHLKATMMKVSDPIIFGHVVRAFLPEVFERYGADLDAAGLSPNNGLGGILDGLADLPNGDEIKAAIEQGLADGPRLAMVNSDKGITNLHVPSDVIVDASMPAMIRTSGHMWGADGQEHDTLAVIPDSSYAGVYQTVIDDCRVNGAFDPTTMGSVPNVGLMASEGRGVRQPRQYLLYYPWQRSSTPSPTRPRCWPRTPSCRWCRPSPPPPTSTSRRVTSRWRAASSPSSPSTSPRTSASATPSPSSATSRRPPRPTSSSCPTSRPRCRSSRPPSPSCRPRASPSPTTRTTRRPTRSATSASATTRSRAAP